MNDPVRDLAAKALPGPWETFGRVVHREGYAELIANTAGDAEARLIALAPDLAQVAANLADALERADKEASVAHDAIWHDNRGMTSNLHSNDNPQSAQSAIWRLHNVARPALAAYRALQERAKAGT
jgi:hypothetical protein